MFYENIPTIVSSTVQALYKNVFVTIDTSLSARLFDFVQTNDQVAGIKAFLSQAALVLCAVFALFIVFVMTQRRALKARQETPATAPATEGAPEQPAGLLRDRWNALLKYLDSTHEAQWKIAVIEADKLVDDALAKAGYSGDTFGDRLSNIQPGTLLSLDGIWWAHKVRNRLAHEVDYFLRYTEARQAIGYFEAALADYSLSDVGFSTHNRQHTRPESLRLFLCAVCGFEHLCVVFVRPYCAAHMDGVSLRSARDARARLRSHSRGARSRSMHKALSFVEGSSDVIAPDSIALDLNLSEAIDAAFLRGHWAEHEEHGGYLRCGHSRRDAPVRIDERLCVVRFRILPTP